MTTKPAAALLDIKKEKNTHGCLNVPPKHQHLLWEWVENEMTKDNQSFQRWNKNILGLDVSFNLYMWSEWTHTWGKTSWCSEVQFVAVHKKSDFFLLIKLDISGFIAKACSKVTPWKPLCPSDVDDSHSENQASKKTTSFANLWSLIYLFWALELNHVHPSCWSELKSYTFSGRNPQWPFTYSSQILTSMIQTGS